MLGHTTSFEELNTLDPQLYKSLLFLKHYEGDAEELTLDFTVSQNDFGMQKTFHWFIMGTKSRSRIEIRFSIFSI
eukprot:TRINITY_DN761_c0_g1_i3.p3 TRINITY_DN761_c0_g1~~TRINITY_DN761_c0_g1_i3.p3  ORF type:complete len:75 (-),score=12.44 TRINITY_DN761_c0_g1_i3:637-861(-)